MRDNQFEKITNVEKPIYNSFTKQGRYALIEKVSSEYYPDARIVGHNLTHANIIKISDNNKDLEFFVERSNGKYSIIECSKLEPVEERSYKLDKKLEKIERFYKEKINSL